MPSECCASESQGIAWAEPQRLSRCSSEHPDLRMVLINARAKRDVISWGFRSCPRRALTSPSSNGSRREKQKQHALPLCAVCRIDPSLDIARLPPYRLCRRSFSSDQAGRSRFELLEWAMARRPGRCVLPGSIAIAAALTNRLVTHFRIRSDRNPTLAFARTAILVGAKASRLSLPSLFEPRPRRRRRRSRRRCFASALPGPRTHPPARRS